MRKRKAKQALRRMIMLLCAAIVLAGILYILFWQLNRTRIENESERYSELYVPQTTEAASPEPSVSPAPTVQESILPDVQDVPLENTAIIYALPTEPPVQDSFADLLALNGDTIGFLRIENVVSLPVVQRGNDNDFYLNHNFEQQDAQEGTLFLDGSNLLVPQDECLIVYGHNMHNGTMFGFLDEYAEPDYLAAHPIVYFDTIYENGVYVPFAVFSASMDDDDPTFFQVRSFFPEGADTQDFIDSLKNRSQINIPVETVSGDSLLLLVTCDYDHEDGRFILALRKLRAGETEDEMAAIVAGST